MTTPPIAAPHLSAALRGLAAALLVLPSVATSVQAQQPEPSARHAGELAQAQELLDDQRPEDALDKVAPILAERPDDARALLLRSTARFMLGDGEAGRTDLDRALANDPSLRQGWLNRAALDLAEERYDAAFEAFRRAEALDPQAVDNHLNLGAVELLRGNLGPASERFARYLKASPRSSDAYYLVATNYAVAGYEALAIEHLRLAVELDDVARLRARTDPNFSPLRGNARFQSLLNVDTYRPPEGAYKASRIYDTPYDPQTAHLLDAVIYTLQLSGRAFDSRVEVTDGWAVVRGDLRVKISNTLGEKGLVQVSAPAESFTPAEWRQRTDELFQGIQIRLLTRRMPEAG